MIIKVEALFEVNEGQLSYGEYPVQYLARLIDKNVSNAIVKTIIIEATKSSDSAYVINKKHE